MAELKERIKQSKFESKGQSGLLHLFSASSLLREQMNQVCKDHGLSVAQFNILRILRGGQPDGYPRCEIQSRMVERAPDITRLLDRLISMGYVRRTRDKNDRRLSVAQITEKGLQNLALLDQPVKQFQEKFEDFLGVEEMDQLIAICAKILKTY